MLYEIKLERPHVFVLGELKYFEYWTTFRSEIDFSNFPGVIFSFKVPGAQTEQKNKENSQVIQILRIAYH